MVAPKSVAVLDAQLVIDATVVYAQNFDLLAANTPNPDGWSGPTGTVATTTTATGAVARSLPNMLRVRTLDSNAIVASKTFETTPGQHYTLRLWHNHRGGPVGASATFAIAGVSVTDATSEWTEIVLPFVATADSETLTVTAFYTVLDDVTLLLTPPPIPLEVVSAEVALDDSRAPYAEARLTVHTPAEDDLEQIDPRDGLRVTLDAALSWTEPDREPQSRTFDLLLHERTIDHETGELELVLESDEALLIDGGNVSAAVDAGAEAHQGSLRAIVDYVLARHGAELEPGADDAVYTVNALGDASTASFEAGVTGWLAGSGTSSLVSSSTFARTGSKCLSWTSSTTGVSYVNAPTVAVVAGHTYAVSMYVRSSVARSMRILYRWYNASNVQIGADANTTAVTDTTTGWTLLSATLTAPAGAVRLNLYPHAVSGASGDNHYLDDVLVRDTTWPDIDALKQQPGVTDWDFLDPLVRAAGLRLFCDEHRAWRLVDPSSYRVPGEVRVSEGTNATRDEDTISLQATRPDGSPVWYTGVVVKYTWTDAAGAQQVAYDAAGTPQKVYLIEINRPYPGQGLASARLAQATGRGRVQDLEALADLNATPGMTLVSTLPATPLQTGVVSSTTWYWSAEGDRHDLMAIRSRGLTDTPATAWVLAEGAWQDVAGIAWNQIDQEGE